MSSPLSSRIAQLFELAPAKAAVQTLAFDWQGKRYVRQLLRLDTYHPVIPGNKWFKLSGILQQWLAKGQYPSRLISTGGAHSNHIRAMADLAKALNLPLHLYIKAHRPPRHSYSLNYCLTQAETNLLFKGEGEPDQHALGWIPEGGSSEAGIAGAGTIWQVVPNETASLWVAAGTGGTAAGLCAQAKAGQQVYVVSALKGEDQLTPIMKSHAPQLPPDWTVDFNHHHGGYGKVSPELAQFVAAIHTQTGWQAETTYVAKVLWATLSHELGPHDYVIVTGEAHASW